MSRFHLLGICVTGMTGLGGVAAFAVPPSAHETARPVDGGLLVRPASGQTLPGDAGARAHTNILLFVRHGVRGRNAAPQPGVETPASLACVYKLVPPAFGCDPSKVTAVPTGGSKLVLVVDAYDDPTAANDLGVFSAQFGLPAVTADNFAVVYATGTKPPQDSTGGWELEESLDIEMAHAMAPDAKVVLVEAASDSMADLLTGEQAAGKLSAAAGGGEVSSSWTVPEFSTEASYESTFAAANTVYFASIGENTEASFPSALQNVVAAGGTTIRRNSHNRYQYQTTWSDSSGGLSAYIAVPAYQSSEKDVSRIVGNQRGTPDFSFYANPSPGLAIYDSTPYQGMVLDWLVAGGSSVPPPALAGIVNVAGSFAASTVAELTSVYTNALDKKEWTDIEHGPCPNGPARKGYDLCTGIGVPNGYSGK